MGFIKHFFAEYKDERVKMQLFNLLNGIAIPVYGETFDISLNWIGNLIRLLITGVGSVGVGVILFSVILRVIVLPFDVYQRIAMRKQNLKMKENQARMEKLQKQYANNKDMYNQKVMEIYRESGISMFSSCLPMILSLVIFIVAINAFTAYSQYSNIENYNMMVKAYNQELTSYCADLDNGASVSDNGTIITVSQDGKHIYYEVAMPTDGTDYTADGYAYVKNAKKSYYIDGDAARADAEIQAALGENLSDDNALKGYFTSKAQDAVVESYNGEVSQKTKFLWIKNVWVTDASYKHPILNYSEFKTEVEREEFSVNGNKVSLNGVTEHTDVYTEGVYNVVTAKLDTAKNAANGYFILIALSIGTILLQQFVSMRSQKEQQKYSSVDGQGASQQKMMLVIMTGMFAIFSFMYSAAFSMYMIMSNVLSLGSTLVINKLVDMSESKKEEKALQEKYNKRFPGRNANNQKKSDKK